MNTNSQREETIATEEIAIEQNMSLLQELLTCNDSVYLWTYARDGHLVKTNCPALVLDIIFENTGCKAYMLEYGKTNTAPLALGAQLGLMWCAAFVRQDGVLVGMRIIGPVLNSEISLRGLDNSLQEFNVPVGFKSRLRHIVRALPVVTTPLFFQYGLMLHYCVTGEKLERSDIQLQLRATGVQGEQDKEDRFKDRHQTYGAEQDMLWMVREGNLNYQAALNRAGGLSGGIRISSDKPMEQAIISCAVFTSLCVRAAIEGGLSPENAYALGDAYIQSMIQCQTVPELASINHEMYKDFIQRVHKHHINTERSPQVQTCCEYIELHLEEPISLRQLAELTGYQDYYLSRKFKQETGVNINNYIKFARVEKAKLLLRTTREPVRDIAQRLRFCSSSYFAQTFQQVTGVTPQQWRDGKK